MTSLLMSYHQHIQSVLRSFEERTISFLVLLLCRCVTASKNEYFLVLKQILTSIHMFQLLAKSVFAVSANGALTHYKFRVVYMSWQLANFPGFSARFRRLLSLLHKSKYVEEMDPQPSTFHKTRLLKNLKKTLHVLLPLSHKHLNNKTKLFIRTENAERVPIHTWC